MAIENAKYYKNTHTDENVGITCLWDGQHVAMPIAVGNRHYDEIKKQVDAGDITIADAD